MTISNSKPIEIYAGATYGDFKAIIESTDGVILGEFDRYETDGTLIKTTNLFDETKCLMLCYVYDISETRHCAYFSKLVPTETWGDDWQKGSYEHNTYAPSKEYYDLIVEFTTHLLTPGQRANSNSYYSVQTINKGDIAWLSTTKNLPELWISNDNSDEE